MTGTPSSESALLATGREISSDGDVFISYASQDAAVADALVSTLERHAIACWIAPRNVKAGSLYAEAIVLAIGVARALIIVLSENAVLSAHVGKEIERAASKRRPIIVLRIDDAALSPSLEYFLSESQWVDGRPQALVGALSKLIVAIRDLPNNTPVILPPAITLGPKFTSRLIASWRHVFALVLTAVVLVALVSTMTFRYLMPKRTEEAIHATAVPPAPMPGASADAQLSHAIADRSVAVLPFVDMSERKDQEYFSDGMSEELIGMLTKIPDLRIAARTSSFYFKDKRATVAEIAAALHVAYLLEGSVRKVGRTMRVTAQLVHADNGYQMWSETYDRRLDDVFKVQDEIAFAVVRVLQVSLSNGTMPKVKGTQNIDAYNLLLQARSIYLRADSRQDYENVVDYLSKSLKSDPTFAPSWALWAVVLSVQVELGYVPRSPATDESRHAAEQALLLDPNLADAHTAAARVYLSDDFNLAQGEMQLRKSLEIDPNNSLALGWAGTLASWRGQFDRSIELLQRSTQIDPANPYRYNDLSGALYNAGKYSEALKANRKAVDLGLGPRRNRWFVEYVLLAQGDATASLAALDNETQEDLRRGCDCRVLAFDALGRKDEADRELASLEKSSAGYVSYVIGRIYANRGDLDQAFRWFDKAYKERDEGVEGIMVDPLLKNAQADPRFKALLRKMGLAS